MATIPTEATLELPLPGALSSLTGSQCSQDHKTTLHFLVTCTHTAPHRGKLSDTDATEVSGSG